MPTDSDDSRRPLKLRCSFDGCGFNTWNEAAFNTHMNAPHIKCTCGRWIVGPSYDRHVGKNADHRPA